MNKTFWAKHPGLVGVFSIIEMMILLAWIFNAMHLMEAISYLILIYGFFLFYSYSFRLILTDHFIAGIRDFWKLDRFKKDREECRLEIEESQLVFRDSNYEEISRMSCFHFTKEQLSELLVYFQANQ